MYPVWWRFPAARTPKIAAKKEKSELSELCWVSTFDVAYRRGLKVSFLQMHNVERAQNGGCVIDEVQMCGQVCFMEPIPVPEEESKGSVQMVRNGLELKTIIQNT